MVHEAKLYNFGSVLVNSEVSYLKIIGFGWHRRHSIMVPIIFPQMVFNIAIIFKCV